MHRSVRRALLPPLNALRAFEAAARHLSFRKAADELHVTPAAVSHQVKALENYFGVELFVRQARALKLTPAARACLPHLREAFDALATAAHLMQSAPCRKTLFVKVPPSFAVKWLGRRLDRFFSAHPDVDLHIDVSPETIDDRPWDGASVSDSDAGSLARPADVAIRFGTGRYPGYRSEKLFTVAVTPMCAPGLLGAEPALRHPHDLRHHTLLHDDTLDTEDGRSKWEMWLGAAGVQDVDLTRGPHFNHAALALDAAIEGVGVALSYPLLAHADLSAGRLIAPFGLALPLDRAYYIVYPEALADQQRLALFRNWLFEEAKAFAQSAE